MSRKAGRVGLAHVAGAEDALLEAADKMAKKLAPGAVKVEVEKKSKKLP